MLTGIQTPSCLLSKAQLLHQLLLDRLLKSFISKKVTQLQEVLPTLQVPHPPSLSAKEKNVVRYITGYFTKKLKDRYKERSKDEQIQTKRELFLLLLSRMQQMR